MPALSLSILLQPYPEEKYQVQALLPKRTGARERDIKPQGDHTRTLQQICTPNGWGEPAGGATKDTDCSHPSFIDAVKGDQEERKETTAIQKEAMSIRQDSVLDNRG